MHDNRSRLICVYPKSGLRSACTGSLRSLRDYFRFGYRGGELEYRSTTDSLLYVWPVM